MNHHKRIEGLPLLPGNNFHDPSLSDFRKSATFVNKNGFTVPKCDYLGIGLTPIPAKTMTVKDLFEMYNYDPSLTYGVPKESSAAMKARKPLVPAWVALEKKTLKFEGYYKETVNDSPAEYYRVRKLNIFYYLEDDTIMVDEPKIENSGLLQGKLLKRHKIPKNDLGEFWHWSDLNLACDIMFYARAIRICSCDEFTRQFYETEGLVLNDPEEIPVDPYLCNRARSLIKPPAPTPSVLCDSRKKFMEHGKKILKFHCVWDERHEDFGDLRKYDLLYHLEDDMVEVAEVHTANDGRDPWKLLLHKIRLPKNWEDLRIDHIIPSTEITPSRKPYVEYYTPADFRIGETIQVFGRRFLIYDMDDYTKQFYRDHFGFTDFLPIEVFPKGQPRKSSQVPPWNGFGSPEDSLQSCLRIVPKRPKVDAMKRLVLELKVLKFGATLDSTRPEDIGREFILIYRLVDDMIGVYEKAVPNSGWRPGKYIDFARIMKPGAWKDDPIYYGPADLYIGSVVEIYGSRFCLNSADCFVLEFMEANPECFPEHAKEAVRKYFECVNLNKDDGKDGSGRGDGRGGAGETCDPGREVCEEPLGEGFFAHLGLGVRKWCNDPCLENPNPCPLKVEWNICKKGDTRPPCPDRREEEEKDESPGPCETPCPGNENMFERTDHVLKQDCQYVWPEPTPPNPRLIEDPVCIPPEKYDYYKNTRFDCFNPPEKKKDEVRCEGCYCPCPPNTKCQNCELLCMRE